MKPSDKLAVRLGSVALAVVSITTIRSTVDSTQIANAQTVSDPLVSIDPARLLDTRTGSSAATIDGESLGAGTVAARSITRVAVAGRADVSSSAVAATVNVTAIGPAASGYLTVYPCSDTVPTTSNVNYKAGTTRAGAALSQLSDDGDICIYSSAPTDLALDVNGYVLDGDTPTALEPVRLVDTRSTAAATATIDGIDVAAGSVDADSITEVVVAGRGGAPDDAEAAVLTVTAVKPAGNGYLTVFPCGGDEPLASTVNFTAGSNVANMTVVGFGTDGDVCIYSSVSTDLLVDLSGYVPNANEPETVTPARLVDTRTGQSTVDGVSAGIGRVNATSVTRVQVAGRGGVPSTAESALLNVTAVNPSANAFLTVYACGISLPTASNVNAASGIVANFALASIGSGGDVCVYSSAETDLIVDVTGYFDGDGTTTTTPTTCSEIAAQFTTKGSANANLDDPESSAVCDGDTVVVSSNGIPDYTYIVTSPGDPDAQDYTFRFPSEPEKASTPTDIALLGAVAVATNGVPIYGPTEGTGGDVLSLGGALSDCGSHNGPGGFHIHLMGTSTTTDCMFTPAEVAAEPQLLGYAFDGFPIYTGNDQYESSWVLDDASLFATDTWSAHVYDPGSGDLDECNGRTDENGNYAYFTTDTFPYVLGCYTGVPTTNATGGTGGGPGGGPGGPGDKRALAGTAGRSGYPDSH